MATALLTAAILTAVPTLPKSDGIDHTADEIRTTITHQIRAHQAYTMRLRARWRKERQAERAAAAAVSPPEPSTPYVSTSGWADELAAVGFPSWAIPQMLYYISRESGGDPSALNPTSNACGLLQIVPYVEGCLDPITNLELGYEKFQASGFAPWGG